ncbi:MAG: DMT family transporter [Anaerolineae bacterium]|jgi:drug/metabolite transporter (DMT)-like permease|nr:DMT family transporter [Anaerolineae bacterium]
METPPTRVPVRGIVMALLTPTFLGVAPIFGKFAILAGADAFGVAALRTMVAISLLWGVYGLFFRRFIFANPAALMGCITVGMINGVGALCYYSGLGRLDAGMVQLINGMYLVIAVLMTRFRGTHIDRRTLMRVGMAMLALTMLTTLGERQLDVVGVGLMLGSALMFAGTLVLGQYVLYEVPAQTMALYALTTMAVIVSMVWLAVGQPLTPEIAAAALPPILLLGVTTALSRLAMYASVKFLGGIQTAIMAVAEIAVALILSVLVLGERLTPAQWAGVALLASSLLLVRQRDLVSEDYNPGAMILANMATLQFQRIAFHKAFGTRETNPDFAILQDMSPEELREIQRMMGAENGAVDPFPIGKSEKLQAVAREAQTEEAVIR